MNTLNKLEKEICQWIRDKQMLMPGDGCVVGVSGGADSVCLLYLLHRLRRILLVELQVVHINHGLRREAVKDAAYVESLCKQWEIPFRIVEEDISAYAKKHGLGTEEAGRNVRYRAFYEAAAHMQVQGTVRIATAHTANDAAETVLFHLLRGSGLSGAAGIRAVNGPIIRPLLQISREQIEQYLQEEGIRWQEDKTNAEDVYARNRIRHGLLPMAVQQINPRSIKHLAQAGETFALAQEYIHMQAQSLLQTLQVEEASTTSVFVPTLQKAPIILQQEAIRLLLDSAAEGLKNISRTHIDAVLALCDNTNGLKELTLPQGIIVQRDHKILRIMRKDPSGE